MIVQILKTGVWEEIPETLLGQYEDRIFGNLKRHRGFYENLRREISGNSLFYDLIRNADTCSISLDMEKYKSLDFYRYWVGNHYSRKFMVRNFGFGDLSEIGKAEILRYVCRNFPLIMDCYYLSGADEIGFAAIFCFPDSRLCLLDPREAPAAIPRFIYDDMAGIDFFCDLESYQAPDRLRQMKSIDSATEKILMTQMNATGKLPDFRLAMDKGINVYRIFGNRVSENYLKAVTGVKRLSFCRRHRLPLFYAVGAALLILARLIVAYQR